MQKDSGIDQRQWDRPAVGLAIDSSCYGANEEDHEDEETPERGRGCACVCEKGR